ncbi:MAG: GTPase Era [Thermoleophilaceae bacterium]|nr:GTPase Era [Thermoleophilaceae bacterium]
MTRSGVVALAGRPNVGKSTLLNRLVGEKVAIVSERPQTTRRAIRGIVTVPDWQMVLVDLPGVQRPRDPMTGRMQSRMARELRDSDAALFVLNGQQRTGPGDRYIARAVAAAGVPALIAVNKADLLDRARMAAALTEAEALGLEEAEIYPGSARTGAGFKPLLEALVAMIPPGPFLYPAEERTDLAPSVRVAELVREQVLRRTRDELPHAVEVEVDETEERPDGLLVIRASIWAERESHKRILIGAGGDMIRQTGTAARREIERVVERRVHLELTVRVRKGWRGDDAMLDRLGIE